MKRLRESLEKGEFVITAELEPPKGTDLTKVLTNAKELVDKVHGVNVTDNQTAVMRMCPLVVCQRLVDLGLDPIMQVTVRDRNRLALQSDLLGAHAIGVRNVLTLTGDPLAVGDHKDAKTVFDIESTQILQIIEGLNRSKDMAGNDLHGATDLWGGAAASPDAPALDIELSKFDKKVNCGARFFQTQGVYDPESFKRFMDKISKYNIKVLAGIILLKSAAMAQHMNKNIPGIKVPEAMIQELDKAGKDHALEVGIQIAAKTIREIRRYCHGVHIMAVGARDKVTEIIRQANL
jgi:methylenetetrahydrofolate reductase (NADPH)